MADVPTRPPTSAPPSRPRPMSFGMLVEPAYRPSRRRVVTMHVTGFVACTLAILTVVLDEVTGPAPWHVVARLVAAVLLLA